MLAEDDALLFPPGVRLVDGELVDDVRGVTIPANATALVVLGDVGRPLSASVQSLVQRWQLAEAHARRDVLRFAWQLNRLGLVNVRFRASRGSRLVSWLALATRTLPFGRLPERHVTRRAIDTSSPARAGATAARALAGRVVALTLGTTVVLAGAGAGAGDLDAPGALAVGGVAGLALLLHELGHVLALGRTPAAILLAGGRTSVVHAAGTARHATLVALAGPSAAVLLGVTLAAVALAERSPAAALAACPAAGHALAATLAARDGRVACGLAERASGVGG